MSRPCAAAGGYGNSKAAPPSTANWRPKPPSPPCSTCPRPEMIHSTAIVDPAARLGQGVSIGPYSLVGPEVTLHDHVEVKSHAVVTGWTEIGEASVIFPHATVGE